MKKQISIRISALTEAQLHELTSKLGMTQTEVISHAVENYHKNKLEGSMIKIKRTTISNHKKHGLYLSKIKTVGDYEVYTDEFKSVFYISKNDVIYAAIFEDEFPGFGKNYKLLEMCEEIVLQESVLSYSLCNNINEMIPDVIQAIEKKLNENRNPA